MWKEVQRTRKKVLSSHFVELSRPSLTTVRLEVLQLSKQQTYPNPIWPIVFTFRVFKLKFFEFMTMVSFPVRKSTKKC